MKQQKQIKYQCLKSRDQEGFKTFNANIVFPAGKITNADSLVLTNFSGQAVNKNIDPLSDIV